MLRASVLVVVLALAATACAAPHVTMPAATADGAAAAVRDPGPAEWRPSDRWVYRWSIGEDTGTRVAEVVGARDVNGVRYWVVRSGDVEHYYTQDLAWAHTARAGVVQTRVDPPQPWLAWPLRVGAAWSHDGRVADRDAGTRTESSHFRVVGIETVQVPAGTFRALKIVRETAGRDADAYWYAPEVRWYVRWLGRRGDVAFEEQLTEYRPAASPVSASAR